MKKSEIKKIIIFFIVWRISLFFFAWLANFSALPYQPSFPRSELLTQFNLPKFIYGFANFDGVHYLTIAKEGYLTTGLIQAFFPVFPFFVFLLNFFVNNLLLSSLIFSNISFVLFLLTIFYYIKLKINKKIAQRLVLLFLFFPTSFFLGAIYNESLFLLLLALNLLFWERKKFFLFVITGLLLTATRIIGVFLPLSLLIVFFLNFWQKKSEKKLVQLIKQREIYLISFCFLGLLSYMIYLWVHFNDPLYFFNVQDKFGASRQTNLVFFPQVIWRYFKMFFTIPFDLKFFYVFQEFSLTIFFLYLLIISFFKKYKIPLELSLFSLFSFFLPSLTGNFSSMPRYVLVCLSCFIVICYFKKKNFLIFLILFLFLQIFNLFLFIQGFWIA